MSGERPRRSGSNAPVRFGSGCGFRPEGEGEAVIRAQTGAWPFLEIGGFRQKTEIIVRSRAARLGMVERMQHGGC